MCSLTIYVDYLSSYSKKTVDKLFFIYNSRCLYLSLFTLKVDHHNVLYHQEIEKEICDSGAECVKKT